MFSSLIFRKWKLAQLLLLFLCVWTWIKYTFVVVLVLYIYLSNFVMEVVGNTQTYSPSSSGIHKYNTYLHTLLSYHTHVCIQCILILNTPKSNAENLKSQTDVFLINNKEQKKKLQSVPHTRNIKFTLLQTEAIVLFKFNVIESLVLSSHRCRQTL